MSEHETEATEVVEEVITTATKPASKTGIYIGAAIAVVIIILGVLYALEKQDRSSTNIFGALIEKQEANKVVAVVNDSEVKQAELDTSIAQFAQAAAVQGVDVTDQRFQDEVSDQALDVIINTRLLKQDAQERGYTVSESDISDRLAAIETELGGAEILAERMTELEIDRDQLQRDISDELLIQQLLDAIFAEADVQVTEEEIAEFYQNAGGAEAGLPALDEVRIQVEEQLRISKEQAAIDTYLQGLRADADITIL